MGGLEKPEDYKDWIKLAEHASTLEELTAVEKTSADRAFRFLAQEFGADFLKQWKGAPHPLQMQIVNLAPWTRKWIVLFARDVRELKPCRGYDSLISRLKGRETFSEGQSVLRTGSRLARAGFIVEIDPSVQSGEVVKKPDLLIRDPKSGDQLYCELATLGPSKPSRDAYETLRAITDVLWGSVPFLLYCGRMQRTLSAAHLQEIVGKVVETLEGVRREGHFRSFVTEGVVEIGIAPKEDEAMLLAWAEERGLKVGEFSGPGYDVDEAMRTKNKIIKEQEQIPTASAGLLVLENTNLFLQKLNAEAATSELEEAVYAWPHLLMVVVTGGWTGKGDEEVRMIGDHVLIRQQVAGLIVENSLILLNRFCGIKVAPGCITSIYNAWRVKERIEW